MSVSGFVVRFLPADKRDPSPALYLSTDPMRRDEDRITRSRVTSCARDVDVFRERKDAEWPIVAWASVESRCRHDGLVVDVVPLADALRDLAS